MKVGYLDTSALAAVLLEQPDADLMVKQLAALDGVVASNLLEAELRSLAHRIWVELDDDTFEKISWILPNRPLTNEFARVLHAGYLRGADLWHVACALYVFEAPAGEPFLTLDQAQREVAGKLGFAVA